EDVVVPVDGVDDVIHLALEVEGALALVARHEPRDELHASEALPHLDDAGEITGGPVRSRVAVRRHGPGRLPNESSTAGHLYLRTQAASSAAVRAGASQGEIRHDRQP